MGDKTKVFSIVKGLIQLDLSINCELALLHFESWLHTECGTLCRYLRVGFLGSDHQRPCRTTCCRCRVGAAAMLRRRSSYAHWRRPPLPLAGPLTEPWQEMNRAVYGSENMDPKVGGWVCAWVFWVVGGGADVLAACW